MYLVPAEEIQTELVIRKSRFITWAGYVADRAEAMQLLARARRDFPDAGHHCWAYRLGPPTSAHGAAMSDDGEPSGTAGKPILNVLEHKGIGDVAVVVTRYSGGIKLGAGGLVRAYSSSAQKIMALMPTRELVERCRIRVELGYADEPVLRRWLSMHGGELLQCAHQETVVCNVRLPSGLVAELQQLAARSDWDVQA